MLSAPDTDLARRDPLLPGLALLLDSDALAEELCRQFPEGDIRGARARYLRYKPSTNCLVAYRLSTGSGEYEVYAKAHRPSAVEKLAKARARLSDPGELGIGRVALDRFAVVVVAFPNDDKLPMLQTWSDVESHRRLLRRVVQGIKPARATSHVLRYKPERRLVARFESRNGGSAVLRAYAPADFARGVAGAFAFSSRGPLRIARCLGMSHADTAVALDWLSGYPLDDMLVDAVDPAMMRTVGVALAELHGQDVETLQVKAVEEERRHLLAVSAAVAFICPRVAYRVMDLASRILSRTSSSRLRPIHGDFHAKQIVMNDATAGFIDLDEAAMGDPTIDVANFLAHLERDVLAGRLSRSHMDMCADSLIEGYRHRAGLTLGGLAPRLAGRLLLLAPHPFRDREPDWPQQIEAIVSRAGEILDQSPMDRPAALAVPTPQIIDPFGITGDPGLPHAADAVNPVMVEHYLPRLAALSNFGELSVERIRVARYRPGRRCLIEYSIHDGTGPRRITMLGKMGRRGADSRTYDLVHLLRARGFRENAADRISVPEPLGLIPELHLWMQTRVEGILATALLTELSGPAVAARLAEVMWKLHTSEVRLDRRHTLDDELDILRDRLCGVSTTQPKLATRITAVVDACDAFVEGIPPVEKPIHRDFYPDQVLVDGDRAWLLDMDLCCMGDPALDAGNCLGHIIEQGLRTGREDALARAAESFRERFLELAGRERAPAVDVYTTLTLARHIWISTQWPDRRHFTERLLELCETRLGLEVAPNGVVTEMMS